MSDFIQINDAASASVIDGVIVPEKDGLFAIFATARHISNNQGGPTMRLQIKINGDIDYESKNLGWQDGPSAQQGATTDFMKAGQEYKIEAQSFNLNASAAGIEVSAKRITE